MGMRDEGLGRHLFQLQLDSERRLAFRQAGAVGHPEDVRVDGNGRLAERDVEYDIGGLAPDARELLQLVTLARNFAAELVDQNARRVDEGLRLGVLKADRLDVLLQALFA